MKRYLFLLSLIVLFVACKKEDPELESSTKVIISVKPELQVVNSMWGGTNSVLVFQESKDFGTENWQYANYLEGFNFEAGYVYLLKVRKEKLTNPPQDASDTRYVFLSLITKNKI